MPAKNEGTLTGFMPNFPKMLQTSTWAPISDLISFTVDEIFWGKLLLSPEGFLYWIKWNVLTYADDIFHIDPSLKGLQKFIDILGESIKNISPKINVKNLNIVKKICI